MTTIDTAGAGTRAADAAAVRRAGALTVATALALPVTAILTAGIRDVEQNPGLIDAVFVGVVAAVGLAVAFGLTPWALHGAPRRAHATAWVAVALGVAAMPFFFWTMVPVIAGGAAATVGWVRRGSSRVDEVLTWTGAAMIVLTMAAYLATS